MGSKKQKTQRIMDVDVPAELMTEVAEIIGETEIEATILGTNDENERISIEFDYSFSDRDSMMEILEMVKDYDEEEDDDSDED